MMYDTDEKAPPSPRRISLTVEIVAAAPAGIHTVAVWWQGEPVSTGPELIRRCCMTDAAASIGPSEARSFDLDIGQITSRVLRAGDAEAFLSLQLKDSNADIWHRLDVARLQLKMRACYCTVFDECWQTDLEQTSAKHLRSCPAAKVPFVLPTHWFESTPQAAAH